MKKVFLFVLALGFMFAGSAFASSPCDGNAVAYTVDCSSFPIGNLGSSFVATISSAYAQGYIYHITLTNSDASVAQTVYVYHKVNSQSTATLLWQVYLGTTSTTATYDATFSDISPLIFNRGLIIRKSAVGSDVRACILAR